MEIINKLKIEKVYRSILNGEMTYESADRWAWKMIELHDDDKLTYEPSSDKDLLWELIKYLYGLDIPSIVNPRETERTNQDILIFLNEKGVEI